MDLYRCPPGKKTYYAAIEVCYLRNDWLSPRLANHGLFPEMPTNSNGISDLLWRIHLPSFQGDGQII